MESDEETATDNPAECSRTHQTPAQEKLQMEIHLLEAKLKLIICRSESLNADGSEQGKIPKLRKKIENIKKLLHQKKQHVLH